MDDLKMTYSFFKEIEHHRKYKKELEKREDIGSYKYLRYFYIEDLCRLFRLENGPTSLPYIDKIHETL